MGFSAEYSHRARLEYVVRSATTGGDIDRCIAMIVLYKDTVDGVIATFDPAVQLQGAANRDRVTCYLDSLLFAMFAKRDVFEGVLYHKYYDDEDPRKRLITIIRLWVNMLRTGRLITTDITQQLQESLAECGWSEAAQLRQQDVSEAFSFITDQLDLPLITLKTDLYHAGKEDTTDDHKFITERLLDVAIPEEIQGTSITLEQCLENYFNNRVEVRRELQRRNTRQASLAESDALEKGGTLHIETAEVDSICESPARESPLPLDPPPGPLGRPALRERTTSIFSERPEPEAQSAKAKAEGGAKMERRRTRGNSTKKEILMPAWQFLNLIPWYTSNQSSTSAEASHMAEFFARTRPMLGICLKRYKMFTNGSSVPLDTRVEIPLEMSSPHFAIGEVGDLEGLAEDRFKLLLQSVVCHRGSTLNSGHYISVVRIPRDAGRESRGSGQSLGQSSTDEGAEDMWWKMDDLGEPRVTRTNIQQILKHERPYLLFYRVVPVEDESDLDDPPPYSEAGGMLTDVDQKLAHLQDDADGRVSQETDRASRRPSVRASPPGESRNSMSSLRPDMSRGPSAPATEPSTPGDDQAGAILEETSRTTSRSGRASRPSTESSKFMSKISQRLSRDKLQPPEIQIQEVSTTDGLDAPAVASDVLVPPPRSSGRNKSKDGSSKDRRGKFMSRGSSLRRRRKEKGEGGEQSCGVM